MGLHATFVHIYRVNWARRTSRGWWDEWDDTALQTQDLLAVNLQICSKLADLQVVCIYVNVFLSETECAQRRINTGIFTYSSLCSSIILCYLLLQWYIILKLSEILNLIWKIQLYLIHIVVINFHQLSNTFIHDKNPPWCLTYQT